VSASQERPSVSGGQVEVPAVMVPPVEVPLREVLIGIGPTARPLRRRHMCVRSR
jgi:hypothetical protein